MGHLIHERRGLTERISLRTAFGQTFSYEVRESGDRIVFCPVRWVANMALHSVKK